MGIAVVVFFVVAANSKQEPVQNAGLREGQNHQIIVGDKVGYETYSWKELPKEAQNAAKNLGYDHKKWNNDVDPPIFNTAWGTLTARQKSDATKLGYTRRTWGLGYVATAAPTAAASTAPPTEAASEKGTDSGTEAGSESDTEAGSDSDTEAGSDSGTEAGSDSGTEDGSDSGTESDTESSDEEEAVG
jgi:hypothetical protein